jgi:hypothetical protein
MSEIGSGYIRDKVVRVHLLLVVLVKCLLDTFYPSCHAFELQEIIG